MMNEGEFLLSSGKRLRSVSAAFQGKQTSQSFYALQEASNARKQLYLVFERITIAKNTIYCGQTVNKGDAWCRTVTAEEAEKAVKRSHHAKKAISARYAKQENDTQEYSGIPEQTNTIQNNTNQNKSNQNNTDQNNTDQNKCITEEYSTKPQSASMLPLSNSRKSEIPESEKKQFSV